MNGIGSSPLLAARKNRPRAGRPHSSSANCSSRSQRGRSSGWGLRERIEVPSGVDVLPVDENVRDPVFALAHE